MDNEHDSYTPYLIRRSERDFLDKILNFASEISEELNILSKEVECLVGNDYTACALSRKSILEKSKLVRTKRTDLLKELENSSITSDHRGYIANLIYSINEIQGFIDSASSYLMLKELDIEPQMRSGIQQMMSQTLQMMDLFLESIKNLSIDLERTIENTEQIKIKEEEIDELKRGLVYVIVNDEKIKTDISCFYTLIEILKSIETISDKIDIAANNVEVIAITHLP